MGLPWFNMFLLPLLLLLLVAVAGTVKVAVTVAVSIFVTSRTRKTVSYFNMALVKNILYMKYFNFS